MVKHLSCLLCINIKPCNVIFDACKRCTRYKRTHALLTNQEEWRHGINLVQMTDGWSNILVVSLEEWVVLNRFLNYQHAKDSKHGNTSVLYFLK